MFAMRSDYHAGLSDQQLVDCCKDNTNLHRYNWTAEVYSFGRCYRLIANYPKILPLFFYSDHGAGLHSNLYPHEISNTSEVHFTWSALKVTRNSNSVNKRFIHITHPWVIYRKKRGYFKSKSSKGTLVFFTHHIPGVEWQGHDDDQYLQELKQLPEKFHPIVLCMHMHDINAGHHKMVRHWGFPIVTVGSIYDDAFIDRFYNLVSQFSYGTSQEWGSQTAYMIEMGIPYFFLGKPPVLVNLTHKEMPKGQVGRFQDDEHKRYVEKSEQLFSQPLDNVSTEQLSFVDEVLGLNSAVSEQETARLIWQSFFTHWRQWYQILLRIIFITLSSVGIIQVLKRIRQQFL
jgi:hypothetical protein